MATNQYFNFYQNQPEQDLTEDLVVESIQIYGHNVKYIPRNTGRVDDIFNETRNNTYDDAYEIEMYLQNVEGFEGDGDLLSKFGVEVRDTMNLICSVKRWNTEVGTPEGQTQPQEGDLIYLPMTDHLLEIKFVEDEEVFYQLGKAYIYTFRCEFFEYNQEQTFNTGDANIDDIQTVNEYTIDLTLNTGTGDYIDGESIYQGPDQANATATAEVRSWNNTTQLLRVANISGSFSATSTVTGVTSGAAWTIGAKNELNMVNNTEADNASIESEAADFIDFSENNPFSENF
jgi:hypothetical protein